LLLLRIAIGGSAIIHGVNCIRAHSPAAGIVELASGVLLLIGFLTPIVSMLLALGAAAVAYGKFPVFSAGVIEDYWMNISVALIATAVVLLGPGSISVDARLFGRRKITIPRRSL